MSDRNQLPLAGETIDPAKVGQAVSPAVPNATINDRKRVSTLPQIFEMI